MRLIFFFLWISPIFIGEGIVARQAIAQSFGDSYLEWQTVASNAVSNRLAEEVPFRLTSYRPDFVPSDFTHSPQSDFELGESFLDRETPGFLENVASHSRQFGSHLSGDYRSFYKADNFKLLGGLFLVGGAIANSSFDQSVRELFVENDLTDPEGEVPEFLHSNKSWGDGLILLPAYAAISVTGKYLLDDPVAYQAGEWGERTIRGILVGTPALLVAQKFTGGSRPNETGHGSNWRPWTDDNGVSGHAFMGAIPFLTAARMSKNRIWKATFIAASTLPGLSRISDDAHYPSQVFLGWGLAWAATSAVDATQIAGANISVEPMVIDGSTGIGFSIRR